MTDRRLGGIGLQVDIVPTQPSSRLGALGVMVDYVPGVGGPTLVTVATTQAQQATLAGSVALGRTVAISQTLVLRRATLRTLAITQAQSATLATTAPQVYQLTRAVSQALSVTLATFKGYQRVVAVVQATAVTRQRLVRLTRAFQPPRRVGTRLTLAPAVARVGRITSLTNVRLVRQIRLTRAITQGQSASLAGVPVTQQLVAAVQTRSLALERVVSLVRAIVQPTAVYVPRGGALERTAVVLPVLQRQQEASLTRALGQAQAVSLEVLDVTPYTEILVSLTQGQAVSITSATGGQTAREFAVSTRGQEFVVAGRSGRFAAGRRGVRFTVEVP